MKLTASDVMKVMVVIQACHPRTAPRNDDPEVTLATASMWADLFNDYGLTVPDLVAGVKQRAQHLPEAPEPAEIIEAARAVRRERAEREPDEMRDARQSALDARLVEAVAELAEAKSLPPLKFTRRQGPNPLTVACPWCKATVGRACTIPNTRDITKPHPSRIEALEATA